MKLWEVPGAVMNWLRRRDRQAAAAMANPIEDSKTAIIDKEQQNAQFALKIAEMEKAVKDVERRLAAAEHNAQKFAETAERAAAGENPKDEDIKQAIEAQERHEAEVANLRLELQKNQAQKRQLMAQLRQSRTRVADAKVKSAVLAARQVGADMRKSMAAQSEVFGATDPLAAITKWEEAVNAAEDTAVGMEHVAAEVEQSSDAALLKRYSPDANRIADRVAALKAKHAKPASAPAAV